MTSDEIRRARDRVVERYGPWTAHNMRLAEGLYTMSSAPVGDEIKLRRVTQIVSDVLHGDLAGARILDLACLEGMYAIELARRGADVVGIEGRAANVEKARFAARVLGLDVDFRQGDVRDLRLDDGQFDIVLCLGILYHLDTTDVFPFVHRIADACTRALVLDTHVAVLPSQTQSFGGFDYRGLELVEHDPESSSEDRLSAVWSSLDNVTAFVFTRPSVERLLARTGFTSVYECHVPAEPDKEVGRVTLLALKGSRIDELVTPTPPQSAESVPERSSLRKISSEGGAVVLTRLLPQRVHLWLRRRRQKAGQPRR